MTPAETTIVLVVAIGVIALVMKWSSRDERPEDASHPPDAVDRLLAEVSGADPETAGEVVAISSEGWAFVPDGHGVQLIPPKDPDEDLPVPVSFGPGPVDPRTRRPLPPGKPGQHLDPGDLTGARVKRGAPWRLEALGRDGDYRAWFFETEEAARAALEMLERRIVRPPKDEYGEPRPPAPDDFDEARRVDEETLRALDEPEE